MTEFSYADVVERLFREFNGQHPLPVIVDMARACLTDLEGEVPPGALAELLERSARQRLTSPTVDRKNQRGDRRRAPAESAVAVMTSRVLPTDSRTVMLSFTDSDGVDSRNYSAQQRHLAPAPVTV